MLPKHARAIGHGRRETGFLQPGQVPPRCYDVCALHSLHSPVSLLARTLQCSSEAVAGGEVVWSTSVNATEGASNDSPVAGTASIISPTGGILTTFEIYGTDGNCSVSTCAPDQGENLIAGQPSNCAFSCSTNTSAITASALVELTGGPVLVRRHRDAPMWGSQTFMRHTLVCNVAPSARLCGSRRN